MLAVLVVAHGVLLYRVLSHATLGIAAAAGAIAPVLIKHFGSFGHAFTARRESASGRDVSKRGSGLTSGFDGAVQTK
jgi:hypothetical protein